MSLKPQFHVTTPVRQEEDIFPTGGTKLFVNGTLIQNLSSVHVSVEHHHGDLVRSRIIIELDGEEVIVTPADLSGLRLAVAEDNAAAA